MISRAVSSVLICLVRMYQMLISPLLGRNCRFEPTCSEYAVQALRKHGAIWGTALTVVRLVKCGPWHPGGLDPVPDEVSIGRSFRRR